MTTSLRIGVIGTGYVGLTTGACLAKLGHDITCVDVVPAKVESLQQGRVPILEAQLSELVQSGLAAGNLRFALGAEQSVEDREIIFLCLPTPEGADGSADLSYVLQAAADLGPLLAPGTIVINKSTVPVGTAAKVAQALQRPDLFVASNPEFLREGQAVHDFFHPDRIIIGADTPEVGRIIAGIYDQIDTPKRIVSTTTAELIKYAANAFLATKISFANSIAALCEATNADAHDVLAGMGLDRRIGPDFLQPGPGWGGSCFPKDTIALVKIADDAGYDFSLLRSVVEANDIQTDRMISKITSLLGDNLQDVTIAAWGIAFKAGTDDTRQSPALKILDRFTSQGVKVQAYDPGAKRAPDGIELFDTALDACQGADILVVFTEWPEFAGIAPAEVKAQLSHPKLLDTRNVLNHNQYHQHGFQVDAIGRRQPASLLTRLA